MTNLDPRYIKNYSLFAVGIKVVVTNKQGKILVLKRSGKVHHPFKWSLPGGAIEKGEDAATAIKRELEEETGLNLLIPRVFAVNVHDDPELSSVIIGYSASTNTENIVLNWEHDEFKFLSKKEALKLDLTNDGRFFIENFQN